MIVIYGSFDVGYEDRDAFDRWFTSLVEIARAEEGCVAYDYLKDPQQPNRGYIVEIWESPEEFEAHMVHPKHVEMIAIGAMVYDMSDVRVAYWHDAKGYATSVRQRPDELVPGREDMKQRYDVCQAEYQKSLTQ